MKELKETHTKLKSSRQIIKEEIADQKIVKEHFVEVPTETVGSLYSNTTVHSLSAHKSWRMS